MSLAALAPRGAVRPGWSTGPLAALAGTGVLLAGVLMLPIALPIGAMYWDLGLYVDAAQRIERGQVPSRDFFAPVGPLGYYLFAGVAKLFPQAHPLLVAQWSTLLMTAPPMALVVRDAAARSPALAWALLLPFLLFTVLPFNTREFYPYPGSDAFGIYNRQAAQLLYVLTAALLFVRDRIALGMTVAVAMSGLFGLKITGFLAGGLVCAWGLVAGRVPFRVAAAAAGAFVVAASMLEALSGIVSAYLVDIATLAGKNGGGLAGRFLQSASVWFGVLAPAGALVLVMAWVDRRRPSLDHPAAWLAVAAFAGLAYETQNTGSQGLIHLWPPLLLAGGWALQRGRALPVTGLVLALAAATALPSAVAITERAARTWTGAARNVALNHRELGPIGRVNARPEVARHANVLKRHYAAHRPAYDALSAAGEMPSFIFYSDAATQLLHLEIAADAARAVRALERERGVRFETVWSLNFTNLLAAALDRDAPRHVAIGADPGRAVPAPGGPEAAAVRNTDLVVRPVCPLTPANRDLLALFEGALADHSRVRLTPCMEAWVHPRFGP